MHAQLRKKRGKLHSALRTDDVNLEMAECLDRVAFIHVDHHIHNGGHQ